MKKKYCFFDIDGTLTDRSTNQVIVPSALEALEKLEENGHFVASADRKGTFSKADLFYKGQRF